MISADAERFCAVWLPAWTGNDPDTLLNYYHRDAFYRDPTVKDGLRGHDEILPYFTKLLGNNPRWVWTPEEILSTGKGFVLKWKAVIPVRDREIIEYGMDIVEIDGDRITRNEVYFDTLPLITAIKERGSA